MNDFFYSYYVNDLIEVNVFFMSMYIYQIEIVILYIYNIYNVNGK